MIMINIALVGVVAVSVHGHGVHANQFDLKVTTLKFGGEERRRADGKEELMLTLSNGEELALSLTPSEELLRLDICGSSSPDSDLDILVTGCEGDDRSVTIGGHGSWDYEAATNVFRRVDEEDTLDGCTSVSPDDGDEDATAAQTLLDDIEAGANCHMHKKRRHCNKDNACFWKPRTKCQARSQPIMSNLDVTAEFEMEVRYYYDSSLLYKYGNEHSKAKAAVREINEHAKVMMRHPTIDWKVHLVFDKEPTFIDLSLHAGPSNALPNFMKWLDERELCERDIAFHHLITNKRSDGVSGVAWLGTVCHGNCYNTGITEIWRSPAGSAGTLAHEFGHNLGALHTFSKQNAGRDCSGIMSYGWAPNEWSDCSRERWLAHYDTFRKASGEERANKCFRPSNDVKDPTKRPTPKPVPAPTPKPANPTKRPTPQPVPAPTPKPISPTKRPTPRPVASPTPKPVPAPTPGSTGDVTVYIGTSSKNSKSKVISKSLVGLTCPSIVSKDNWSGGYTSSERFSVSVSGRWITVKRVDNAEGWSLRLTLKCSKAVPSNPTKRPTPKPVPSPTPKPVSPTKRPTPRPVTPKPVPAPTPASTGGCKCSGRVDSSNGKGGPDCSISSWCYTEIGACSDGSKSNTFTDQEWSYKACKAGAGPAPVSSPTPKPTPTSKPTPEPRPTPTSKPTPEPRTTTPPQTTVPTTKPPSGYKQMPGSGWCMEANGEDGRPRYTMPWPTTHAKTKAACDADVNCVAYAWGETKRVGMIYSTTNCKADCSNTSWQKDPSLIAKAGWHSGRTYWKDCTCNVKNYK